MHEISGQDEEKGHMERKADRQNNLGRAVWYEQVCLNGTVSQYHSQNGYALGNIEKSNTLSHAFILTFKPLIFLIFLDSTNNPLLDALCAKVDSITAAGTSRYAWTKL